MFSSLLTSEFSSYQLNAESKNPILHTLVMPWVEYQQHQLIKEHKRSGEHLESCWT